MREIRNVLAQFEKAGKIAFNASIGIVVGMLIEPWIGFAAGVTAQAVLSEYAEKVGPAIYEVVNRDKHRFVVLLDYVSKKVERSEDA